MALYIIEMHIYLGECARLLWILGVVQAVYGVCVCVVGTQSYTHAKICCSMIRTVLTVERLSWTVKNHQSFRLLWLEKKRNIVDRIFNDLCECLIRLSAQTTCALLSEITVHSFKKANQHVRWAVSNSRWPTFARPRIEFIAGADVTKTWDQITLSLCGCSLRNKKKNAQNMWEYVPNV